MFINFKSDNSGDTSIRHDSIVAVYTNVDRSCKNEGSVTILLSNGNSLRIASYPTVEQCNTLVHQIETTISDIEEESSIDPNRNYQFIIPDNISANEETE